MIRSVRRLLLVSLCLTVPGIASAEAVAEETVPPQPQLTIEAVLVAPETPSADTLCRLRVRILNRGDRIASQLGFSVAINGASVPVYANQLFMFPLEAGAVSELALFNFWSTETSRPMPADGKLTVEVALQEAQWMKIEMVEEVETWTPLGPVPGLPVSARVTLPMAR